MARGRGAGKALGRAGAAACLLLLAAGCGKIQLPWKKAEPAAEPTGATVATALPDSRTDAKLPYPDFELIFENGRALQGRTGQAVVALRPMGDLVVTSGRITVCDPLGFPGAEPLAEPIPNGRYPVTLSVVTLVQNQWVAAAMVQIAEGKPIRWENAKTSSALRRIGAGEFYGYPVESGIAGFMDPSAGEALLRWMRRDAEHYEKSLIDRMKSEGTWSSGNIKLRDAGEANLVAFSSGFGEGFYGSWWGYDAEGRVVRLITEFGVL